MLALNNIISLGTAGHCLIALLLCLFGLYWFAPAFFAGRELTQAEYRYIAAHGGKRADCPWWCGFYPSAWTVKGMLDWLLPLAVGVACWWLL